MTREQFIHKDYRYLLGDLALEIANLKYILKDEMKVEYVPFQSSVIANNDAFLTLWNSTHRTASLAFVRIISEHLVYLYAEYLYPERVISKVYLNYKELNNCKVNGDKIKPSEIREQLAKAYSGFSSIWDSYHYFIHPSFMQGSLLELAGTNETGFSDMIKLNNWILDVLTKIKGRYKRELKEAGLHQKYVDFINENSQSN